VTRVIDMADPARGDEPNEFQGYHHDAGVSFFVVDAPPESGQIGSAFSPTYLKVRDPL
jgi:hypothetical protein